jgi:hypothetical protein
MKEGSAMKWLLRIVGVLAVIYLVFASVVLAAMIQTPDRFGLFMKHVPEELVWHALPSRRMWLWARSGSLAYGDEAPDFTLSTHDHSRRVALSSYRGQKPVVLVFGSYT